MLLSQLEDKLSVVVETSAEHSADELLDAVSELDKAVKENRSSIHPRLAHFLERRSYSKALAWLRGDEGSLSIECPIVE